MHDKNKCYSFSRPENKCLNKMQSLELCDIVIFFFVSTVFNFKTKKKNLNRNSFISYINWHRNVSWTNKKQQTKKIHFSFCCFLFYFIILIFLINLSYIVFTVHQAIFQIKNNKLRRNENNRIYRLTWLIRKPSLKT